MGKYSKKSKFIKKRNNNKDYIIKEKSSPKSKIISIKKRNKKRIVQKNKVAKSSKAQKFKNIPLKPKNEINKCKRIKLKSLRSLFIQPTKDIKTMDINELKEFAHKFDINPDINYQLLSHLKRCETEIYNKYISKYKYTLNFKDALKLNCFEKRYILNTLDEYNKNMKNYQLKEGIIDSIEKITSFSRLKLFNLLFFLQSQEIIEMKVEELEKYILSFSIKETLAFKIPNNYGNLELKYYSLLTIIINLLFQKIEGDNNSQFEQDLNSVFDKEIYFDFKYQAKPTKQMR